MRRVTIAVIGNGMTSRANLEALITDTAEAMDKVAIATLYDKKQSAGQVWAEQLAQAKNIPWVAYAGNDYATLLKEHSDREIKFFVLWDDEDPDCQQAAYMAQEYGILAYDLTNGLMRISLNADPITEPVKADIPEIETQVSDEPVTPPEPKATKSRRVSAEELEAAIEDALAADEEPEELDDEEEEEEVIDDLGDLMKAVIEEFAVIFADKVGEVLIEKFKNLK